MKASSTAVSIRNLKSLFSCSSVLSSFSFIDFFIFIACYVFTRLWTGNEYNWAAIPMGISLLMTILFGIMAIINDNMWESKYSRIGKQMKAGIDYWERVQEIKKILERE